MKKNLLPQFYSWDLGLLVLVFSSFKELFTACRKAEKQEKLVEKVIN